MNCYVQIFRSLRKWMLGDDAPTIYQMVIHEKRRPASENVRRYDSPTCAEGTEIGCSSRDLECLRIDIGLHRQ